jgi:transposase
MPIPPGKCQPTEVISQLKRHEIQVLLKAGFSVTDVAQRSETSADTVRRVRSEEAVTHTDDGAARKARRVGRPSKAAPFSTQVSGWLAQEPELPTQELLRRAKEAGYSGSKTAFYALVAGLRPSQVVPIVRFEGLPGEFSQHDFGHVDVTFVDGRKVRVHFFASRLKYSRFARVTLVKNERVETIVRCLARDFVDFGGLPLMAVFDRPRTIVRKGGKGREVEAFNDTFAQAIVDLGVGLEMCAPRSGNQKGSVERLVGWVKSSFFKPRKFLDEADLEAQLAAWHVEVNTKTPCRATGVIPEMRRQEELPRLRPVKVFPETLALRVPVFVGPTAEVMFEGVPYSMPPKATHVAGTLFLYEHHVRIVAGRFEVEHRRRSKGDPPAPLPEHRAQKIAAVHGARAKLYEKRQQVLNLGPAALALLTEITHREPRLSRRRVEELFALLEEHGDEALRAAITTTVRDGVLTVVGVRRALAAVSEERNLADGSLASSVAKQSDEAVLRRVPAQSRGTAGVVKGRAATSAASLPLTTPRTRVPPADSRQSRHAEAVQLPLAFSVAKAKRGAS